MYSKKDIEALLKSTQIEGLKRGITPPNFIRYSSKELASETDEKLYEMLDGEHREEGQTLSIASHNKIRDELLRRELRRASRPGKIAKVSFVLSILSALISVLSNLDELKGFWVRLLEAASILLG